MAGQNHSDPKTLYLAGIEFLPAPYQKGDLPFEDLQVTINDNAYSLRYGGKAQRIDDPCPIPIEPDRFNINLKYDYEPGYNWLALSCIENPDGTLSPLQDGNEFPAHPIFEPGSLLAVNFTFADGIVIIGTVDTVTDD